MPIVDPLADRFNVAGHRKSSARHRLEQCIRRPVVIRGGHGHIREAEDTRHLVVRNVVQELDRVANPEPFDPTFGDGVARHHGPEEVTTGSMLQDEGNGLKEILGADVRFHTSRIEDHGCPIRDPETRGQGRIAWAWSEDFRRYATVSRDNNRGTIGPKSKFSRQSQIPPAVGVQGVGPADKPA